MLHQSPGTMEFCLEEILFLLFVRDGTVCIRFLRDTGGKAMELGTGGDGEGWLVEFDVGN